MALWYHYVGTDERPVCLEDAERALQAASTDFYLDGDVIVLRYGYGENGQEDLECGQITVKTFTDPAEMPDRRFFEEWIRGKRSQPRLEEILNHARCVVSIQLINLEFWRDNPRERTLRPLVDWLMQTFTGVLYFEGDFFDRQGPVP